MIETGKINKKILNCNLFLSSIYDLTLRIVENTTQENLDDLSSVLEEYNNANIALQNAIKTFILEVAEVPSDEIDVEPGDNGFRVN